MPTWLSTSLGNGPDMSAMVLAWRIGIALALGGVVSLIYRWARRGEPIQACFVATLVLLAAVIAMATQIIGDNIARAFSLVGALSVVRFRTVVKDTQDTAFVIFAVVVGMAAGANHVAVALVGLTVIGCGSLLLWPSPRPGGWLQPGVRLDLRLGLGEHIRANAEAALAVSAEHFELISAGTTRKGPSLELSYRLRLRPGCSPAALVMELNALEGVEGVELSQAI